LCYGNALFQSFRFGLEFRLAGYKNFIDILGFCALLYTFDVPVHILLECLPADETLWIQGHEGMAGALDTGFIFLVQAFDVPRPLSAG
jgi:hypothetical protein